MHSSEWVLSQSPYGAKWFATGWSPPTAPTGPRSRNPLTGLSGLQRFLVEPFYRELLESQSPYGAKWFATLPWSAFVPLGAATRRNPLTGLSGLQPLALLPRAQALGPVVAIPLRG